MVWDGIEKRRVITKEEFCPAHIELVSDLAVIKNSLMNIEKCVTEGTSFRNGVVMSFIALSLTIIIQIIAFSFLFGQMERQVKINTDRLTLIESRMNK
uniref:Uncharacterized protein n=1 Tax=viral metagenome TaxID=1070528 RepID=A0A6M3KS47_9ZZZZ